MGDVSDTDAQVRARLGVWRAQLFDDTMQLFVRALAQRVQACFCLAHEALAVWEEVGGRWGAYAPLDGKRPSSDRAELTAIILATYVPFPIWLVTDSEYARRTVQWIKDHLEKGHAAAMNRHSAHGHSANTT